MSERPHGLRAEKRMEKCHWCDQLFPEGEHREYECYQNKKMAEFMTALQEEKARERIVGDAYAQGYADAMREAEKKYQRVVSAAGRVLTELDIIRRSDQAKRMVHIDTHGELRTALDDLSEK